MKPTFAAHFSLLLILAACFGCSDRYGTIKQNELSADIAVEGEDQEATTDAVTAEITPDAKETLQLEKADEAKIETASNDGEKFPDHLQNLDSGSFTDQPLMDPANADPSMMTQAMTADVEVQSLDSPSQAEKKPAAPRSPASAPKHAASAPKKSAPVAKSEAPKPEEPKRDVASVSEEPKKSSGPSEPFPHFYKLAIALAVIGFFAHASGVQKKRRQEELTQLMNNLKKD